jgi:CHAT domain-containing protein
MRRPPFSLVTALILLSAVAVQSRTLLEDLTYIAPVRSVGPRVSTSPTHRPCAQEIPADGTVPVVQCRSVSSAALTRPAVSRLWNRTRKQLDAGNPEALHTAALFGLLWSDNEGPSLSSINESLSSLQRTANPAALSARVLGDLSAAYLVRAGKTQNARDLHEAITSAERALTLEPRNPVARFNLALALDWSGLNGQAMEAWTLFLLVDSTSGWAEEAKARLRALTFEAVPVTPPAAGASAAEFRAYVSSSPQDARLYGWDHCLGEWGQAVLRGDTARAGEHLRQAQALGDALVRRGGDATLAEAVHAIHARSGAHSATRALARAHAEYAAGQAAYHDVNYQRAWAHFGRVLEIRPASPLLMNWARVFHAAMVAQGGKLDHAEQTLLPLTRSDTLRYPALAGRARWVLGTVLLRKGEYEDALLEAEEGARLLGRIAETEHQGGAQYVAADAQFHLGATFAAHAAAHRALTTLRTYRRSVWLLNALAVAAKTAEADGLPVVAIRFQDERVGLAQRIAQPVRVAEARMGRARILASAGMPVRAWADIEASQPLLDSVPEGSPRIWLEMELRFARADIFAASDPVRAAANLDSVLEMADSSLIAPRRLRARVGRARARLALGDVPGATADLDTASLLLVQKRDAIANTEYRASLTETGRGVFDRLAMLHLEKRDTVCALWYLERGRTSFGATPPGRTPVDSSQHGCASAAQTRRETSVAVNEFWRMPANEVAVAYALLGDTLLTWTVAAASVRLVRQTVDARSLIGTVEELRSSLEHGEDTRTLRPALAALYDRLLAPVNAQLGDVNTTLVVVADGELASVPFSALYDRRNGRYLVEARPLRYAGSLRDASRTREGGTSRKATTLLIADPAFDPRIHRGLARLPGARQEVDSIAAAYRNHAVLADSGASREALQASLAGATVVHFAGHAVFDDQRPERSYLVLAAGRSAPDRGWLTAGEMEDLSLRHVDLFVLSACQTLRSGSGRAGGFAGFAGALLDAGVGGVVGSLWRVDDRLTAPLMVEFHRAYRRPGDGPRALREAQLRLLRSPDPALRSPAAWAGFRYAGN